MITLLRRYQIAKRCRSGVGIRFNGVEIDSGQKDEKERGEFLIYIFKRKRGAHFFGSYCRVSRCTRVTTGACFVIFSR